MCWRSNTACCFFTQDEHVVADVMDWMRGSSLQGAVLFVVGGIVHNTRLALFTIKHALILPSSDAVHCLYYIIHSRVSSCIVWRSPISVALGDPVGVDWPVDWTGMDRVGMGVCRYNVYIYLLPTLSCPPPLCFAYHHPLQVIAFVIGRYLLRDAVVANVTSRYAKFNAIDTALSREGWRLVVMMRLSPLVPWNVLNYLLSITGT